jgi:hypothetical protein
MTDLIKKLKSMKNATKDDVDKVIYDYSYKNVIKDLQELDIDPSALEDEELKQLLAEEINKNRTFSKGALLGAGSILLLELLG